MRYFLAALFALAAALVEPAGAGALIGDAAVSYRAVRTVTVDGTSYSGTVYTEPGHQRHEQTLLGMTEIFLLDTRQARGVLMLPAVDSYLEFPFPPLMAELGAPDLLRHPDGMATISGIRTTRYRIDHTAADGSRAQGELWVSRTRILMKFDLSITRPHGGRPTAIAMELSGVRIGPVDPALFAVPQGLVRLPASALTQFLGGNRG